MGPLSGESGRRDVHAYMCMILDVWKRGLVRACPARLKARRELVGARRHA